MSAGQNREIVDEGRAMTPEEEDELDDTVPSLHNAAPCSHLPPLRIITADPFLPPLNDDTDDESEGAPGGGGEGEDLGPPRHRGSSAPPTFRFVYDQQQHHAHQDEDIPAVDPYVPAAPTPTSTLPRPHHKPNSKLINGHGVGTGSGTKRPRVSSCCRQCRERRVWCSRTSPCQSCLTRGNDCDWSGGFPVGNIPRSRPSSASTPRSSNGAYPYPPPASRSRPSTAQSTGSPTQAMAASVSPQARSPVSPTLSGRSTGGGAGTGVGGPGARARCRNSCHQCHTRKIRCSRTYPCTGCSSRGLECNWEGGIPIATAADDSNLRAAMADMETRAQALRQKCLQILAAGA